MRIPAILILAFSLIGCNSGDNDDNDNIEVLRINSDNTETLRINASGLTDSVTLVERLAGRLYEVDGNGEHLIDIERNQGVFDLAVLYSRQNTGCELTTADRDRALTWDLKCGVAQACQDHVDSVCGKRAIAAGNEFNFTYQSFDNRCRADAANAAVTFNSSCQGLNNTEVGNPHKPAYIVSLATILVQTKRHEIVDTEINGDIATVTFGITGGCGEHDFELIIEEDFSSVGEGEVETETMPHYGTDNDGCTDSIRVVRHFDLVPVKEIYRRQFPSAVGEQEVLLREIGRYRFVLD